MKIKDFEYYNVIQLRGPTHSIDRSLPVPLPAEDYADGSWTDWLDSNTLPYLISIIDSFKEIMTVTLVRLLRLAPNSEVKQHRVSTLGLEVERSVIRLTKPIVNNMDIMFYLNDIPVDMKPGEC